ncbi:hypothetical protein [Acinetobacter sp. c3-l95]
MGAACVNQDFQNIANQPAQPPIVLQILQSNHQSNKQYFDNLTGFGRVYDLSDQSQFNAKELAQYAKQQNCGQGNTHVYSFSIQLNSAEFNQKSRDDAAQILEQINQQKYIDVVAVRQPFMSLFKPTLISKQPVRIYFDDAQSKQIQTWLKK